METETPTPIDAAELANLHASNHGMDPAAAPGALVDIMRRFTNRPATAAQAAWDYARERGAK